MVNSQQGWNQMSSQEVHVSVSCPESQNIALFVQASAPADQYQLTDRATKYAILLITLTFMAFFVFETLTGQRLHPMQ
ncbi:inner membrane CreD family protein, partial [Salmonella enterica subsp. enterica serovar Virginia]|nr:inner membrane CreD family protein [Salmonella enterica subsp. enterica serovar Virginia]